MREIREREEEEAEQEDSAKPEEETSEEALLQMIKKLLHPQPNQRKTRQLKKKAKPRMKYPVEKTGNPKKKVSLKKSAPPFPILIWKVLIFPVCNFTE